HEAGPAPPRADVAGSPVEVHGQHDQQRLLDERWQRDLLDAFGGHTALRDAMAGAGARGRAAPPRAARAAAQLAAARLRPGEEGEIRARLDAAQHREAIARGPATLHEALAADERGA